MRSSFSMSLLYHAYVYLEFLILACTIYILAPAISFYQREGFEIQYSGLDEATGEKDYVMAWQQK